MPVEYKIPKVHQNGRQANEQPYMPPRNENNDYSNDFAQIDQNYSTNGLLVYLHYLK